MENQIVQDWKKLKKELSTTMEDMVEESNKDSDVLELMLNMLYSSKIKSRKGRK